MAKLYRTLSISLAVCAAALFPSGLTAQQLSFGRENGWKDWNLQGIGLERDKEGYMELTLARGGETQDAKTDLLAHFDHGLLDDSSGHYFVSGPASVASRVFSHIGDGSAVFHGRTPIVYTAGQNALWGPHQVWGSFTIEFWLYPTEGDDGETILQWQGTRTSSGPEQGQLFRVTFEDSHLVWTFQNLFAPSPSAPAVTVRLSGVSTLIPDQWHHHMIRYDANTGLLEYLVDGVSEAVTYVTPSKTQDGSPYTIMTGRSSGQLLVGPRYTGALDELRVERAWVETPQLNRYSPTSGGGARGIAVSRIFDLGLPDSQVRAIHINYRNVGASQAVFSYRMANAIRYQWQPGGPTLKSLASSPATEESSWFRFDPQQPLLSQAPGGKLPQGRFLQLRIELLPSGTNDESPHIQRLVVDYQKNLPPPPPEAVFLTPGNGQLKVSWRPVMKGQVDGYVLFFGTSPGEYFGTSAAQGSSPLDVGNVTSYTLTGLINEQVYYVAVAAYQKIPRPDTPGTYERHLSRNSREVYARPQRTMP